MERSVAGPPPSAAKRPTWCMEIWVTVSIYWPLLLYGFVWLTVPVPAAAELEKIANIALSQSQEKDYTSKFPQGMTILCIGMAFFRKHMKAASKVLG
jgi:hypothetical protein